MSLTFWAALVIVALTLVALVKRYETRLVLCVSGLLMCIISLDPMAAYNQFAKSMTTGNLIQSICSAMGFAFLVSYTKCDIHLVQLLTRPMKSLGLFLIPCCTLLTAVINAAIPSAAGCAAAVGATLIPLMIRSGITPAGAGAAVLAGTYGSNFNPGGAHPVMISGMAGIEPMEFIIENAFTYTILSLVGALMITVVEVALRDHKGSGDLGNIQTDTTGGISKVNILYAIAPMVPLVILLLGNTYVPAIKMGVAQAMLIGVTYTMIVTRINPQNAFKEFFNGAGKGYGNVLGIIISAGVFAAGLREAGVVDALIEALKQANEYARVGGALGTWAMAVLMGSGDAATFAFNEAVTPHAAEFGMTISELGNTVMCAAQLGRTMSPIAGVVILLAGMSQVSPIDLVKRTAVPMITAWFILILFL
ncbi:C4-dicarboxylate transporter DcuC [Parasutterella secunda]|uniref:C4-dicarboxylate transporter DcuC n=1 Tax=Parasutterella secunda TaxID=626947 RepID=UPI0025A43736|nr:C4-dicarboxylate transporter DcuC [Parasutterella secunda]MDM8217769.1 C4-dicarboxylate transporter DcuC [Parasutterella secunda]MDM8227318.1 C4-dicarboxylate transporter DcuC [Parasutterella secunda]HJI94009.1 C4-dicarboxylate transporter DcuC [Sutterellaceae bacterium]